MATIVQNIWAYVRQMLPCMGIALAAFLLQTPQRRRQLAERGLSSGPGREGALLLFGMFSAGLAALTLFPAGFWRMERWTAVWRGELRLFPRIDWEIQWAAINWVPFRTISSAWNSGWNRFILAGNLLMFSPLGFFPALLWRNPRWWKSTLVGLCASCFIEFVQVFIGRSTDVDDIIVNTLGALVGFWVFLVLRHLFPALCSKFQCVEQKGRL